MIVLAIILAIIAVAVFIVTKIVGKKTDDLDTERMSKRVSLIAAFGGGGLALLFFLLSLFYIVNPGEVGVEILFGKVNNYSESGFHVKNPFASIVTLNLRTQKYELNLEGASKDLQEIGVDIAINYRLDYEKISELYNKVGIDYEIKVINPAVLNLAKAGISQFPIADIIVKRSDLAATIYESLAARLKQYYIILETVNLNNIKFSTEFTKAVTEKQVQEQGVQTAEYMRQQAEKNKQSTILAAEGEAEKQRLLRANTSKEVIELKWIERWNGQLPQYIAGESSIPMINFNK